MLRRIATLLLTLSVTFAGFMAKPHAAACCVMRQAMHDCCKADHQLRTADCCRGDQQHGQRAVHSQQAPPPSLPVAIVPMVVSVQPPGVAEMLRSPLARGLAPPGSLLGQHTSLLL